MTPLLIVSAPFFSAQSAEPCCGSLEQRISALEDTVVGNANGNLEISLSGTMNRGLLIWNDATEAGVYGVTNDNDGSNFSIEGQVPQIGYGFSVGLVMEVDILNAGSGDVSQVNKSGATAIALSELAIVIGHAAFGEAALGTTSSRGSSGSANEMDLSATEAAAYVDITDTSGAFFLNGSTAGGSKRLFNVTWGDLIDSLDAPDGNVITYRTPDILGVSASMLWGEDDVWSVATSFENSRKSTVRIKAGVGVSEDNDRDRNTEPNNRIISGSFAALHQLSGLNLSIAAGRRTSIEPLRVNTGARQRPPPASFLYGKAGWLTHFSPTSSTGFYVEYGRFQDFLGHQASVATVSSLSGVRPAAICTGAGIACLINSSGAEVWGIGAVHHIANADPIDFDTDIQLYAGYRHQSADIALVDHIGHRTSSARFKPLQTVLIGALIEF